MADRFRGRAQRRGVGLGIAIALLGFVGCGPAPPPERVVLIVIDTLRRDALSCYGAERATPNIDALARSGQQFEAVSSSFHQTSMSMGALFTGRTPSIESADPRKPIELTGLTWCGMQRFAGSRKQRTCIPASVPTLGELMKSQGFATYGVVTNSILFRPFGIDRGFDQWHEIGANTFRRKWARSAVHHSRRAALVNQRVGELLDEAQPSKFFLYVHYMDVHDYAESADFSKQRELYSNAVVRADAAVGDLMEILEARGLRKGTTVILTSDHGERLGEEHVLDGTLFHGGNPSFEELLEVPFIVSPALPDKRMRLLRGQDVYGWMAEWMGDPAPQPAELEPEELFLTEKKYWTYRMGGFKSFRSRADASHVLVELDADPGERVDASEQYPDVVRAHTARIEALARALQLSAARDFELSPEDRDKLRAQGYLE